MRSLLAALLLLGPAFTGCLDTSVFEELRNDLEAEDEFENRVLLREEVAFTPAGVADPNKTFEDEDDASSEWNTSVQVPEGVRSVTVTFTINFTSPASPTGTLVDPRQVEVYVDPSEGEQRNLTRSQPATVGFDFPRPEPGEWTLGMQARGNGTVTFNVDAIVPVDAPRLN